MAVQGQLHSNGFVNELIILMGSRPRSPVPEGHGHQEQRQKMWEGGASALISVRRGKARQGSLDNLKIG